jgi:hypothetical protein
MGGKVFSAKGPTSNDGCAVNSGPTRNQQHHHGISYAESSIEIPTAFDETTPLICSRQSPIRYAETSGLDSTLQMQDSQTLYNIAYVKHKTHSQLHK